MLWFILHIYKRIVAKIVVIFHLRRVFFYSVWMIQSKPTLFSPYFSGVHYVARNYVLFSDKLHRDEYLWIALTYLYVFTFKLSWLRDIRKRPRDQNISLWFFQLNPVKTQASLKYLNIDTILFSIRKDLKCLQPIYN